MFEDDDDDDEEDEDDDKDEDDVEGEYAIRICLFALKPTCELIFSAYV